MYVCVGVGVCGCVCCGVLVAILLVSSLGRNLVVVLLASSLGRNPACGEPPPNSQELLTNIRPVRPLGDLGGDLGGDLLLVSILGGSPACVEPRS